MFVLSFHQILMLRLQLSLDLVHADIQFERTFPTGMLGTPPHLDVTLTTDSRRVIAIESKFLETYPARTGVRPFRDTYFPASGGRAHSLVAARAPPSGRVSGGGKRRLEIRAGRNSG